MIVEGEGVCFDLIFNFFYSLGRGCKLMFFFLPSFDMWKEEGKQVSFFFKYFFFIDEWLRKGRGLIFFYKFIMGG